MSYHTIEITMQLPSWAMLEAALATWIESTEFPPPPALKIDFMNLANQIHADLQHVIVDMKAAAAADKPDNTDLL